MDTSKDSVLVNRTSAKMTKKQLELNNRRNLAVSLRLDGHSYRDICEAMWELETRGEVSLPDSYDERYVWKDVNWVIENSENTTAESGRMLRAMELANLNRMQSAIMPKAMSGNLRAIDRVLKIMERRARYVPNLDQPQKVEVTQKTWESEIITLIKEGRITIDDVREIDPGIARKVLAEFTESGGTKELQAGGNQIEGEYVDLGKADEAVPRESNSQ
jgi:hypothetical protein